MENRLSKKVMFGYGSAALSFNFVWGMVSAYVTIYFINVLGIGIAAAGAIVLIARLWDGFNDPIMGSIVDNTNTRFGKYRPFLLIGILPLTIFTILIFQNPSLSVTGKTIYAGAVYILFGMSYTLANIPYMSMLSTLTKDPDERTILVTIKNIFVMFGVMIPSIIITSIAITDAGYIQKGFTLASFVGAFLVIVTMLIAFFSTKNRKYVSTVTNASKITWKQRIDAVFSNKPLLVLMGLMVVFSIQGVLLGAQTLYVVDGLGQGAMAFTFMLVMLPGMFIAMGSMIWMKKLEKRKVVQIGMAIYIIGSLLFQFSPATIMPLLLTAAFIKGIGFGYVGIMIFSMIADCVDYGYHLTGKQQGGIIFSATTFVQKAISGLGAAGLSAVLIYINFAPNSIGLQTVQTVAGLKFLNGVFPAILGLVVFLLMAKYPLTKQEMLNLKSEKI